MDGSINWFSVTPKLLHISPIWLHVTDVKKKVWRHGFLMVWCSTYINVTYSKLGVLYVITRAHIGNARNLAVEEAHTQC